MKKMFLTEEYPPSKDCQEERNLTERSDILGREIEESRKLTYHKEQF